MTLLDFVDKALQIADKRNLAKENPITLTTPNASGVRFVYVVSILEPNHVTLPLNVIWVVADSSSPDYKKVFRRVSALSSDDYRNTWSEITTYEEIYDQAQFYDRSSAFALGEVESTSSQPASTLTKGTFRILNNPSSGEDPVVVSSNDPRMSDSRAPTPHDHPNLPASLIAGVQGIDSFFVNVEASRSPVAGQILVITGVSSDDPQKYIADWKTPTQDDIQYDGPAFTDITVNGPATINENTSVQLTAIANFDDGSTQNIQPNWSIIVGSEFATLSSSTGNLTAAEVDSDKPIRIQAEWTHPASNVRHTRTFDTEIIDTTVYKVLESITILGPLEVGENTQASYTVRANYNDGSNASVLPTAFTSSNPSAGTFNSTTGILTVPNLSTNQNTTLSATYTERGVTQTTTLAITARDLTVYPVAANITGPDSVSENTQVTYKLTVDFSDSTSRVVAVTNWARTNPEAGSINASTGVFQAPTQLTSDKTTDITASFTSEGQTVSASKTITAVDTTNYPMSMVIQGADTIDEETTENYTLLVTYKDNTTATVTSNTWSTATPYATVNNGAVSALAVTSDINFTLSSSYTEHGKTIVAEKPITIVDTTNYPVSAQIIGSGVMQEGNTQTLIFRVSYTDSTVADRSVTWVSSDPSILSVSGNSITASQVTADELVTISASYTEHGVTLNESLNVNVVDGTLYPESATIVGLNSVSENSTVFYSLEVTFEGGSVQTVSADSWSIDNSEAGSINSNGEFTANNRTSDIPAVISASFTVDGRSVSATKNITVVDTTIYPDTATILGADNVDENTNSDYQFEVTYTNGSKQIVTPAWSVDNSSFGSIDSSGRLTANGVVNNQTLVITGTYSEEGVDFTETKSVIINDTTIYPDSLVINGPATVQENGSIDLTVVVTYTDGSSAVVTPSISVTGDGSISGMTYTAPANVTSDTDIIVSTSYEENGVTRSANKTITITDETLYPESAVINGPATVTENSSASFTFEVTYPNATTANVVPNWSVDNPIASINSAGVLTIGENDTRSDVTITVTGSYTLDGQTVTATREFTISDDTPYPVSYEITGPDTVNEENNYQFDFVTTYSDNSTVIESATWSVDDTVSASIDGSGLLTVNSLTEQKTIIVTGVANVDGSDQTVNKTITAEDTTVYPSSLTVDGPSSIAEGETEQYFATVTNSDSSTGVITPIWSSDNPNLTIDVNGNATVGDIAVNESAIITASYTDEGVTVTDTFSISMTVAARVPVSVAINGADNIPEGGTESYSAVVTYDDASEETYTDAGNWTIDVGSVDSNGNVSAPSSMTDDSSAILNYSYTENGSTVTQTKNITYVDIFPTSLAISGPDVAIENGSDIQLDAAITNTDFTVNNVTNESNWYSSDENLATVTLGLVTPTNNVVGDQTVTITVEYIYDGQLTLTETKNITIQENVVRPVSVDVTGNLAVNEGDTTSLIATITNDDNTTQDVTSTGTWTSSDESVATVSNGTVTVSNNVVGNQSVQISYTYTAPTGEIVSISKTLNITDTIKRPSFVLITGNNTVEEGATESLIATVTYDDGSTLDVTNSATWSSSDNATATVSNGVVTGVAENASAITISVSYMENSINVTRDFSMTVTAANLPLPRSGYHPYVNLVDQAPETVLTPTLLADMFQNTSASTDDGVQFLGTGGDGIDTFAWFMHPAELGEVAKDKFQEIGNGNFVGAWEGVYAPNRDAAPYFDFMPPSSGMLVTLEGRQWYIYRSDFPIENRTYQVLDFPNN